MIRAITNYQIFVENKINIFRGSLKNVLNRYFNANKLLNFDNIVG